MLERNLIPLRLFWTNAVMIWNFEYFEYLAVSCWIWSPTSFRVVELYKNNGNGTKLGRGCSETGFYSSEEKMEKHLYFNIYVSI